MKPRQQKRCKVAGAAEILGESPRTIRHQAQAGKIPGAAKPFGTWTFDVALLHAFLAQKERQALEAAHRADNANRRLPNERLRTPGTPKGHFAQAIEKLRQTAKRRLLEDPK
jgi:hypothetical protein